MRVRLGLRRSTAYLAFVATLSLGSTPYAGEPSADDVAAARALGVRGVKLADSGHCADAIEPLRRASTLVHAPSILGRLGECEVEVGHLVEGSELLERVVREKLSSDAPPAFVAAQERAAKVLAKTRPKIGSLHIVVNAPAGVAVRVMVDDALVPDVLVGADRPTDPGTHRVSASATGYVADSKAVTLAEGSRAEVSLSLSVDPAAAPAASSAAPVASAPPSATPIASSPVPAPTPSSTIVLPPPEPPRSSLLVPGYVALGLGAAGLAVGAIAGAMAISDRSDLDKSCVDRACPPGTSGKIDSMRTAATLSTVFFAIAGVGLAAGTYLIVTSPPQGSGSGMALRLGGAF